MRGDFMHVLPRQNAEKLQKSEIVPKGLDLSHSKACTTHISAPGCLLGGRTRGLARFVTVSALACRSPKNGWPCARRATTLPFAQVAGRAFACSPPWEGNRRVWAGRARV